MKLDKRVVMSRGEVRQIGDESKRTLRIIGTDETPDSYDTILRSDGWDFSRFKKNPIFMWCHDAQSLPIGRVRNIEDVVVTRGEGDAAKEVKGKAFDVEFADKETYPFADTVYRLYKKGFLRGASVGFDTLEREEIDDTQKAKAMGFEKGHGAILVKNRLVELSGTSIPSNENALVDELRSIAPEGARAWFDSQKDQKIDDIWLSSALMRIRRAQVRMWASGDGSSRAGDFSEEEAATVSAAAGLETTDMGALVGWFGEVGMDKCVAELDGKEGVKDAKSVCERLREAKAQSEESEEDDEGSDHEEEEDEEDRDDEAEQSRKPVENLAILDEAIEQLMVLRDYIQSLVDADATGEEDEEVEEGQTDVVPQGIPAGAAGGKAGSKRTNKGSKGKRVKTLEDVGNLVRRAEQRFLGCLNTLAKRTELLSLELQLNDVATEVRELRDKKTGGGSPQKSSKKDPYENLLKGETGDLLKSIKEAQK